jgi:transposase
MNTTYGGQFDFESVSLGSLAVIYPLLKQMQVEEIVDQHLPADSQAEFSNGRLLSLLVAARSYSPVALSNVEEWSTVSGADILWDIPAEKLNDDRLGRLLDRFFPQRHSILSSIALHVAEQFDIPLRDVHYDPTHILFTGAYSNAAREGVVKKKSEEAAAEILDDLLTPAHITKGRAMDDAPKGSKMIHAGLCVQVDEYGAFPFYGHAVDGNQNGRQAVREQFELLRKHLSAAKLTMISDRGTYSVGHLLRLKDSGCDAICSAPWGEFSKLFDKQFESLQWTRASYLSIEQTRRRTRNSSLPREEYQLATVSQTLTDEKTKREINCRVIFAHSTADEKVVRQQRQKQIDRITADFKKIQASVAAGRAYSDEASVSRRVAKVLGTAAAAKYFQCEMIALKKAELKTLPPPGRGCKPPTHRFEFTFNEEQRQSDECYDGYNAIVTTVPETSSDTLFTKYKEQSFSELVNAHFKGPLAVRPVFLHTPERVESLVFVLMIALMLHFLIQRTYRRNLPPDATVKEKRTTTLTILTAFRNYAMLIQHHRSQRIVHLTRLTARQRQILDRLEIQTPAQYLSRLLPRPPN